MKSTALGRVCAINMGQAPPGDSYNDEGQGLPLIAGAGDFGERTPAAKKHTTAPQRLSLPGDIILCIRATIGDRNWSDREYCLGRGVAGLRPNQGELEAQYLWHWLGISQATLLRKAKGSTFQQIDREAIHSLVIPLPPLPEQRRIAAILDKADALRRKRAEALRLTDDFLRSAFLDMFGDPVTNPKGWRADRLDAAADIASGVTKGRQLDTSRVVTVPYMRVANVQDGHLVLDDVKEIEVLPEEVARYRLRPGDVLLTEGGDPDKLGRGAVWHGTIDPCVHQNHIFRVRPDQSRLLPEFLSAQLGSSRGKRYFLRAAKQTTGIASINMTQLSGFPVLLPPLQGQAAYSDLVRRFAVFRGRSTKRSDRADDLFHSLVQRAFRGEL